MDMKKFLYILLVAMLVAASSCNKDGVIEQGHYPEVHIAGAADLVVRVGEELVVEPTYNYVDNRTIYSWAMGLTVLSTKPTLRYTFTEIGSFYVTLYVTNDVGTTAYDIYIRVIEREAPVIELAGAAEGFRIAQGSTLHFAPAVRQSPVEYRYSWSVDGQQVAETLEYDFVGKDFGHHTLRFDVLSDYGNAFIEFDVEVCLSSEMPFGWGFERTEFTVPLNRELLLVAYDIACEVEQYEWRVDGTLQATTTEPRYRFSSNAVGRYTIEPTAVCVIDGRRVEFQTRLTVDVCEAEGVYRRPAISSSSRHWNKVYEYTPGPGQFINDTAMGGFAGTESTADAAISYAERRLHRQINSTTNTFVSLGSFGGYIVVGFDHSITSSDGDYDFVVRGNAFERSSEPGIVYVMQDENGDGLPNDTWYELAGSDRLAADTKVGYAVTYFRPVADGMPVQWRDNCGGAGEVKYLSAYHKQPSYFPAWVEGESYTLRGTYLKERVAVENFQVVLSPFDWGYADNFSPIDMLSSGAGDAAITANRFRISDAVYADGTPVKLQYIDFVKVQTACLANCGELGEQSTEIIGIYQLRDE